MRVFQRTKVPGRWPHHPTSGNGPPARPLVRLKPVSYRRRAVPQQPTQVGLPCISALWLWRTTDDAPHDRWLPTLSPWWWHQSPSPGWGPSRKLDYGLQNEIYIAYDIINVLKENITCRNTERYVFAGSKNTGNSFSFRRKQRTLIGVGTYVHKLGWNNNMYLHVLYYVQVFGQLWLTVITLISIINFWSYGKSVNYGDKYGIFHFTESVNLPHLLYGQLWEKAGNFVFEDA